jgi:hypothetical protein
MLKYNITNDNHYVWCAGNATTNSWIEVLDEEFSFFFSVTTIRNMDTPYILRFLQPVLAH